ncbi:hypothetical protein [Luteimonas panaciterrae]|uniref:hypothetical protein n=1 Tax=Luteimonas panaciterrae TaxID=363885 RepID=UPI001CFC28A7|nr:hypothetical protein [Luteimonas panaciterrae]
MTQINGLAVTAWIRTPHSTTGKVTEGPTTAAPASVTPPRPTAAETVMDFGPVAKLFDDLVERKAAGQTDVISA